MEQNRRKQGEAMSLNSSDDEKFFLQWKEFQTNLSQNYSGLRKSGEFSDVTLVCEDGGRVPCHKLILSSSSPHLHSLLSSPSLQPSPTYQTKPLTLKGVSTLQLGLVLDFIYYGEVGLQLLILLLLLLLLLLLILLLGRSGQGGPILLPGPGGEIATERSH